MGRAIRRTSQFKKNYKRAVKQRRNLEELYDIILTIQHDEPLCLNRKDHALTGSMIGYRELHIKPDWLLVYQIRGDELVLVDCGTHTELFD